MGDAASVAVKPPGLDVTVYDVTGNCPTRGVEKETDAECRPPSP
jgi:hypothetical protein